MVGLLLPGPLTLKRCEKAEAKLSQWLRSPHAATEGNGGADPAGQSTRVVKTGTIHADCCWHGLVDDTGVRRCYGVLVLWN